MKKLSVKEVLRSVRLPLPLKIGGPHRPQKGGGYNRQRDRKQVIREWKDHAKE